MARPRRTTVDAFYEVFADFTIQEQAAALNCLAQLHRLAVRESKQGRATEAERPLLAEEA